MSSPIRGLGQSPTKVELVHFILNLIEKCLDMDLTSGDKIICFFLNCTILLLGLHILLPGLDEIGWTAMPVM